MPTAEPALRVLYLERDEAAAAPALAALRASGQSLSFEVVGDRVRFESLRGRYDIVLSAYQLDGWSALDALVILRSRGSELPFIVVNEMLEPEDAMACIRAGAADWVRQDELARLPEAVARARADAELRTESRRSRRALAQSERRFRALALATSDLISLCDRLGRVHGRLTRWQGYTGQSVSQLQGYGWLEAIHPDERGLLRDALEQPGTPTPFTREARIRAADGAYRVFRLQGVPIRSVIDDTLVEWILGASDITEEREREALVLTAQRLEAVGQLASGIAHDFNNLLTSIMGFSQFLVDQLPPDNPYRSDAEEIYRAGELAAILTRKLLAFSRRQPIHPQPLDLNRAVEEACHLLGRLLGEHIRLELVLKARPALVKADAGAIEQLVLNLAVNARDAMPQGGRLRISTRLAELPAGLLHAGGVVPGGRWIVLTVADEGTGMPPDVLVRIFEPFFTTKGGSRGTGLGLSTVHGIVQQQKGHIVVQSEPQRGSTFELYFPALVELEPPRVARPLGAGSGSETILLVEDQAAIRTLAERTLRRAGYTVLSAESGSAARELAGRTGSIQLVVMDVLLPGERGPRVARELKRLHPEAGLLFISGHDQLETEDSLAAGPGPHWFLQKPWSPDQLLSMVRAALDATATAL